MIIKSNRVVNVDFKDDVPVYSNANTGNSVSADIIAESEAHAREIIEEAKEEAELIKENARTEAMVFKEHLRLQNEDTIKIEIKLAQSQGFDQGYKEGLDQGKEHAYEVSMKELEKLVNEAEKVRDDTYEFRKRQAKDLEEDIVKMVIDIFERIYKKASEEDVDMIISLVDKGIENLDMTDKLTIITCKEDYDFLDVNRNDILAKASFVDDLDLKFDSEMKKGDCILETSKGSIDVSLVKQLEELKFFLKEILESEE